MQDNKCINNEEGNQLNWHGLSKRINGSKVSDICANTIANIEGTSKRGGGLGKQRRNLLLAEIECMHSEMELVT